MPKRRLKQDLRAKVARRRIAAMREEPPRLQRRVNDQAISLAREWRVLGRAATVVALLTSPALFVLLYSSYDWALPWALLGAVGGRRSSSAAASTSSRTS